MSHLVVHIGTHKTGTTHIQNTLFANRDHLQTYGVRYPRIGRASGQHVLTTKWITTLPPVYASRTTVEEDWARVTPGDDTVILSSEEFSRAGPDHVNFAQLGAFAQGFDALTIVCMLRTPLDFLQSSYLEVIKKQDCLPIGAFAQTVMSDQHADALHYDPNPLLDQLQAELPQARLVFLAYEAAKAQEGGVLGAMLRAVGLDIPSEEIRTAPKEKANISAPVLAAWMAHQVTRPAPAGRGVIELAADALAPTLEGRVPSLFTEGERLALHDYFAPRIARFDARVQCFDPGFRSDPFPTLTGRFGRDEIPSNVWARFARLIFDARSAPSAPLNLGAVA